jgi:translation elongation factor EF-1beta
VRAVKLLSNEIVRRAMPLVMAGAVGAAGAVLAQRRLGERRKLSLSPGPPSVPVAVPTAPPPPSPGTPQPGPPPPPAPTPEPPTPTPDPIPDPPEPAPQPPSPTPSEDVDLEQAVRSALQEAASDGAGAVDVEIAGGMVVLRGQVDSPEAIRELERAAARVRGVEGVRVLLHLPGRASRRSR